MGRNKPPLPFSGQSQVQQQAANILEKVLTLKLLGHWKMFVQNFVVIT